MGEEYVGKITHYFGKIGVGVIELSAPLAVGDRISIKTHDGGFEQIVQSMQIEHKNIEKAQAGQSIGIKLEKAAHEGNPVFRITP
jgi:putative protease